MRRLKELVQEETGIEPEHQRLLYGPKQMEDGKRLCDYPPLGNGASILLVLRLPGGGNWTSSQSDSNSPQPPNANASSRLAKIDVSVPRSSEECMISLERDCVRMPCGHSINPDALMDYCWSEIESVKYEIKCPLCEKEWPLDVIKRYGGPSDNEMTELEKGLANNACRKNPNIQKCPFCGVFCERQNTSANSVICIVCSKKGSENKVFCWLCLRPWKNPSMTAAACGNAQCEVNREKLNRLKESPMVGVSFFPERKIYKLRACPGCATVIEFKSGCKQMACAKCGTQFCFICLRKRVCGCWQCGSYDTHCELAPIQQILPN